MLDKVGSPFHKFVGFPVLRFLKRSPEYVAIDGLDDADRPRKVVTFRDAATPGLREAPVQLGIRQDGADRRGELLVVAGIDEQSGPAFEELRQPTHPRCDERGSSRERLECREWKPLAPRSEHRDVECGMQVRCVDPLSGERHAMLDSQSCGQCLERLAARTIADHAQPKPRMRAAADQRRERSQKHVMRLLGPERSDDADDDVLLCEPEGGAGLRTLAPIEPNAIRHDLDEAP